jgi:hypothetical protein
MNEDLAERFARIDQIKHDIHVIPLCLHSNLDGRTVQRRRP